MERFGRYLLVESIGSGGMAEVFRAIVIGAAGFTRPVAIKRVLPNLSKDEQLVEMLIAEAKLAASLSHPNIIPILDLGREAGSYFMAMEFVAGQTLRALLARSIRHRAPLPQPFAFNAVQLALGALQYTHTRTDANGNPRNIVHRDISPDNVMVAYPGGVYLMDFGIARAADLASLTQAGMLRGKPAYMSPEIIAGAPVSNALDLYAMGVVLHELLAMRPMRPPKRDLAMMHEAAKGEVPRFEDLGVDVPKMAADVVYRALAFDPAQRFPDAAAFAAAIEDVQARLSWTWGPAQTAALMQQLFAPEQEQELRAHRETQLTALAISKASASKLPSLLARLEGRENAGRAPRWGLAAGAAAVLALGVGTGIAFSPSAPAQPPPVVTPAPVPREIPDAASAPDAAPTSAPVAAPAPVVPAKPRPRPRDEGKPAASKATGTLTLLSKPWGKVVVDGKDTGQFTPLTDYRIAAGRHTIDIVNDQLKLSARLVVDVPPGAKVRETRQLR